MKFFAQHHARNALPRLSLVAIGLALLGFDPVGGVRADNPFRKLISDRDFEQDKHRIKHDILESGELTVANMPLTGAEVLAVRSGSIADGQGLRSGDVIYRIGRQEIWGDMPWFRRTPRQVQYLFASPESGRSNFLAEPGSIGISHRPFSRLDIAYLKLRNNRSPDWDKNVVAAMLTWRDDAVFAETAWHHAIESGYTADRLSDYFKAIFKMQQPQGAGAATADFLSHFESIKAVPTVFLDGLIPLLCSAGRIDDLGELANLRSPNFPWTPDDIIRLQSWRDATAAEDAVSSLLEQASSGQKRENTEQLQVLSGDPAGQEFRLPASGRVAAGKLQIDRFGLSRPLKNVHLHLELKLRTTGANTNIPSTFWVAVVKRDDGASTAPLRFPAQRPYHSSRLVSAALVAGGNGRSDRLSLSSSELEATWNLWSRHLSIPEEFAVTTRTELDRVAQDNGVPTSREVITLDLVRIDNRVGVYLNGAPCLQLPVDPVIDDIAFHLHLSGVLFEPLAFQVFEL